mmetsp:Transcript_41269/g.82958  ORF Transcript_41269/g.82958 Transcript_41269/m.82958 type:complete len:317 (+) Transcript_41269:219-1169(+)
MVASPGSVLLGGVRAALDAAEGADGVVENVAQDDAGPRLALRQVVVELRRNLLHLRKVPPGDVGKVVVLVVVADVVGEHVERAVVGVRLGLAVHDVVLGDEVSGGGMYAARKEGRQQEVPHHLEPAQIDHGGVECKLNDPVDDKPFVDGNEIWLYDHWPQRVGKDLAEHEQRFLDSVLDVRPSGGGNEPALDCCWDVCVDPVLALVAMVRHVIFFESNAIREYDGPIRYHSTQLVQSVILESEEMGKLVDRQEQRVVCGGTHDIDCSQIPWPAPILSPHCHKDLQSHRSSNAVLSEGLRAEELLNFRVRLENFDLP